MHQACPCLHIEPCDPNCTCVKGYSSRGCSRCCSYGSKEQQRAAALHIVAALQDYRNEANMMTLVVKAQYPDGGRMARVCRTMDELGKTIVGCFLTDTTPVEVTVEPFQFQELPDHA